MADISKIQIESGVYDIKDETARSKINIVASPKSYQNRKYLFVGDSYAVGYQGSGVDNIEGFFTKVKNDLNLTGQIVCANGYGFLGMNNNLTWKSLLQSTTINNKETFTDIIICGGMNDRATDENMDSAMADLFSYLETNFTNAIIHVGCVGRYAKTTDENIRNMIRIGSLYKVITTKYGHKYIDNSELILHNMSWFISDNIHPNTYGENQLAFGIKQYITNGRITRLMNVNNLENQNVDSITPASGISLSNFGTYSIINESDVTFYFSGAIAFTEPVTFNNNQDVKIGDFTSSYLCGSPDQQGLCVVVPGYVYSTNEVNGSHFVKVDFRVHNTANGELYMNFFTISDDGGFRSLTITEISFPYGVLSGRANSHYC